MKNLARIISRALSLDSDAAVTAIEYALIASLIAVAIITAVTLLGTNLAAIFNYIAGKVTAPA